VVAIADAIRPEEAGHAAARRHGLAQRNALVVARPEHHALAVVDVDRRDEHLVRELTEVVDGQRLGEVALELVDREDARGEVAGVEKVAQPGRAEERGDVEARPGVTTAPRKAIRVEEHVERNVLPVRRRDQRARARAHEDVGLDPDLFAGLEHAEVGEPARRAARPDEGHLQALSVARRRHVFTAGGA